MWANRLTRKYRDGVEEFLSFAKTHMKNDKIRCPCVDCGNHRSHSVDEVRRHLLARGIICSYQTWYLHGEMCFNPSSKNKSKEPIIEEDVGDNLFDMVNDLEEQFVHRPELFEAMINDVEMPLYDGCSKYTKLSALVKLWNMKASGGWTNSSFTALLEFLREVLPVDNKIPASMYEAKKTLSTLGMEYEKIHACPNDCALYRNAYEDLDECPICKESRWKKGKNPTNCSKGVPAKVLWYIPPAPRLRRLFRNAEHAKNLTWHHDKRVEDGMLRHPADAPQWKTFDADHPEFCAEPRNLRLGLSADGMNPHGNMSSRHSTWPVILVNYNLPPKLSMKRKFLMLTLLISGPQQPGNDIDVYLAPLIDDLKSLWEKGIEVRDAYRQETFTLRAMLMWTINDFPAYGNLSGYSVKSSIGCPVCMKETSSIRLKNGKKTVYLGHRRFLPQNHRYRKQKKAFDGNTEERTPPRVLTGEDVYEMVKDLKVVLGKRKRSNNTPVVDGPWKKRSIFYELPYWRTLFVRHCLDVMHIEKNVCESIVGTLLDIPNKSKDGEKARLDLKELKIRLNLIPTKKGNATYLPPAKYTLSRQEKRKLCEWLASVKVPNGYSSNFKRLVSMKDLRLIGMKTHDCHILMQQLLPLALRGVLTKDVRFAITKLCSFFNSICSKVIDPLTLESLQSELVKTLCLLEKYFPPSFFDIMIHLTVHLVREVKLCGPVYLRWMYPFERYMKVLKGYVKNRNRPEGCIVESYIAEESVEFCSEYLSTTEAIGLPKTTNIDCKGLSIGIPSPVNRCEWEIACLYTLHNRVEVEPFIEVHLQELRDRNPRRGRNERLVQDEHNRTFRQWLRRHVLFQKDGFSHELMNLARGPSTIVTRYTSYFVNGFTFYTRERDEKHPVQNSGVSIHAKAMHISSAKDKNPVFGTMNYFGFIEDIWELDYCGLHVALFKCKWADNNYVRIDSDGITVVDFRRLGYKNDPFIMASQAIQVFYTTDPSNVELSLVVPMKPKLIHGQEDEEDCSDIPSFTLGLPPVEDIDEFDDDVSHLVRPDIEWTRVEEAKRKKKKT